MPPEELAEPKQEISTSGTSISAARFLGPIEADVQAFHKQQTEISKYADFDAYDKEVKKVMLKDTKLDPFRVPAYDGLMNSLHRWKVIASSTGKMTPDQKREVASNYFNKVIVPMYQRMGSQPPSEKVWQEQAYDRALKWNLDDAYDNNWSRGYYEGFRQYENAMKLGVSFLGGMAKDYFSLFPSGIPKGQGVREHYEEEARKIPVVGGFMKSLDRSISQDTFWHDIQPNHGWGDKAQSLIAEQTMMLPLYFASGGFAGGIMEGLGTGGGLTAKLLANPAGKLAGHLLANGTEGAAYGYAMANDDDKKDWWRMAIAQAVFGTAIHFGFGGVGKVFKSITSSSASKKAAADVLQKGLKDADSGDLKENLIRSLGGIMAAGGRPAAHEWIDAAMNFARHTEHLSDQDYGQAVQNAIKEDPARNHGVTTIGTYIKKYVKEHFDGRSFDNLTGLEKHELEVHVGSLIEEAGNRVPETVQSVAKQAGTDAVESTKNGKNPNGAKQIAERANEIHQENVKNGMPDTPENKARAQKMAEMEYAEKNAKAAARAAKANAAKPVKEAQDINARKNGASYPKDTPIGIRVSKPKYGHGGVNYDLEFEDPRDKAAYIIGNRGKSAAHDSIAEWYTRSGPITEAEAHSQRIKDFIAKAIKKGANPDEPIKIPKIGANAEVKVKPKPTTSASSRVAPTVSYRTTSRVSKTGERSVSFNTQHSWIVYAKKAVKEAGLKWNNEDIQKWLYEMVDNDPREFAKDLHEHFYPKDLKDQGIWFESQSTPTLGKEDPNFLAFMYNYTDQMPKEFAEALSYAIEETAKFEKNMEGTVSTDLQKNEYAKNVWNHVAEMIHHPKFTSGEEANIYRSSYPNMRTPSKWQGSKTLAEIEDNERNMIKEMFKGNPTAGKAAMAAYEAAASSRRSAIKLKDPEARKAANFAIDDVLVSTGERERMEF
ncbi:MAG TPA: hypothetical protein VII99_16845 [Bacteroidia bacterium]